MKGGSFWMQGNDREFYGNTSAVSAFMVTVDGLTPNAKVAFNGLPDYYSTDEIYADAAGQVYLWLPENWDTTGVTPRSPSAASSPRLRSGASGTTHTFAANGYNYTVTIDSSVGGTVAEQGAPLPLESLKIDDFSVADGYIAIRFTAKPATWLYGFADLIVIRASETLPIPDTDDTILDLSGAELQLEGSDAATLVVPLAPDSPNMFFKVVSPDTP